MSRFFRDSLRERVSKRTKAARGRWHTCTAGGCGKTENLTVPGPLGPGTGAIRQESFMLSHLSAPQTPGLKPCVCPGPDGSGMLRFSHLPADARRTRMPPAQGVFRPLATTNFHSKPTILHTLNIICAKNTGINIDFTIC